MNLVIDEAIWSWDQIAFSFRWPGFDRTLLSDVTFLSIDSLTLIDFKMGELLDRCAIQRRKRLNRR